MSVLYALTSSKIPQESLANGTCPGVTIFFSPLIKNTSYAKYDKCLLPISLHLVTPDDCVFKLNGMMNK